MSEYSDFKFGIGGHCWRLMQREREESGGRLIDRRSIPYCLAEVGGLQLKRGECWYLCYPDSEHGWKNCFMYSNITMEDAISVLEHYRDTGIVDWSPVSQRLEREAV